ncbi:FAD-dependent monooxygenase [Stigmatella aurantiaca]|uniref:FAD-dependent monooxygenase n=1 Tax=Stigmatella aurantiaca (strain DW4/3-1) TaxID=378806 RepID=Q08V55_STIAD|nr:FAD-dependent monooxygenase [Stigmatella aurantiaca]ADO74982.1 FAD-dependent monooxygenase [Stigmatella aurantiaca DW4/3-1]EAU64369.1 FAD-dependent monooxygenase [Stigmatella aurantiaca DW4/3-1]
MTRERVEVAVVGGGPVGLMVACELALAGVGVSVFERRTERVSQSRALSLHPRSLEVLALRGLADRFMARGQRLPLGHYAALETRLDFSVLETAFPFSLFIPQTVTEALLEARARELGVDIRRGHLLTRLEQFPEEVHLEGTCGGGTFHAAARYVVGADGARSAVRTLAGIAFPGADATMSLMLGDIVLSEPLPQPALVVSNLKGVLMIAPLGDGLHHRAVVLDPERTGVPVSEPVTLEELAGSVRAIAGTDFGMKAPFWLSRFGNETRHAATYRDGRVFLAGDAAHVHLPAGGQGLNVGLQDAMNLGWKLVGVLRGWAPEPLLDSYQHERHPVGAHLIQNTLSQSALLYATHPAGQALRAAMSKLLTLPTANRMLAEQISAFDVAYPDPVLPAPPGMAAEPGVTGKRLPDFALHCEDGVTRTLYSLLHEGRWLMLRRPSAGGPASQAVPWGRWTSTVVAEPQGGPEELRPWPSLLVRPDGRVGYVARA